jgi:hypothetical protein
LVRLLSQKDWAFVLEDENNVKEIAHEKDRTQEEDSACHIEQVNFRVRFPHLPEDHDLQKPEAKH